LAAAGTFTILVTLGRDGSEMQADSHNAAFRARRRNADR
jgi:hypothetical protein